MTRHRPHAQQPEPVLRAEPPPRSIRARPRTASVTDKISAITLSRRTPRGWLIGFGLAFLVVMVMLWP